MRIEKIRINKDQSIKVEFFLITKEMAGDAEDEYLRAIFKSNRVAHQGFYDRLAELKPFVVAMCELQPSDVNRLKIRGAEFTFTKKDNIFGAKIFAERTLNKSKIGTDVETPHMTEETYQQNEKVEMLLDPNCVIILQLLIEEASAYVKGYSDQVSIFNGEE